MVHKLIEYSAGLSS